MADVDKAFGLRPVRMRDGRPWNGVTVPMYKPSSASAKVRVGDPVLRVAGANAVRVTAGTSVYEIGEIPLCTLATVGDGNRISGVVVDVETQVSAPGTRGSAAASSDVLHVCMDPDVVFAIQANGALAVASAVGKNAVLINEDSGSDTLGLSGMEINTTSDAPDADASNQLLILELTSDPERNDVTGHPVYHVLITNHTEVNGAIGV